ncbi:MAG: peptide chain release factor N(5)-glutamine methyltransferase [Pyrinomonadaceae bacterium]
MSERETLSTIAEALVEATFILRKAGVAESRRDAGTLLMYALKRDRAFLITHSDADVEDEDLARFRQWVARRAAGEPLQYITGRQEFYGLEFEVTPDVLIPRPETELLVEQSLALLRDTSEPRVCDVGTGSGCITVALLHERADMRAVALDISPAALQVAARNAALHVVKERVEFRVSDCFDALTRDGEHHSGATFDIIVSNPPYIAADEIGDLQREVREHEPRAALTPGGDGLDMIRRLVAEAPSFLVNGGHFLFEIGFNQHRAVRELIDPRVWTLLDIHTDLQGIPRVVALRRAK